MRQRSGSTITAFTPFPKVMMATAVKRACDACHRRKVKCDGVNPCRNCSSAQLSCTYHAIPQKKGPKGSRAKVISELRETQRQTSLSAKVQSRLSCLGSPAVPTLYPNAGLLSPDLARRSAEFYFANMYSILPILNRQRLEQHALAWMDHNPDTYCLLTSLSAFMLLQPGMSVPSGDPVFDHPAAPIASSQLLIEETVRVRRGYDYSETPTFDSLCTSFFLFGCCYALDFHDKAWFHLREATTLAHLMGMGSEEYYAQLGQGPSSRHRRLYWLLLVAERSHALKYNRPLTLQPTINLPSADDAGNALNHQLSGYVQLATLFRMFDDSFTFTWNKTYRELSQAYPGMSRKIGAEAIPSYLLDNEPQLAEMRAGQSWLKTVAWQMNVHNGTGSLNEPDMPYQYSLPLSPDFSSVASQLSAHANEGLSPTMAVKLLEITRGLLDVLSMQAPSGDPFAYGPQQQLASLLHLLAVLRDGEYQLLPLLFMKVHDILPRLANPMLQRTPETLCSVELFDGFGNAGMAEPAISSIWNGFKQEPYAPPRVDDVVTDTSSSNGAPSGADMNSPFPIANSPVTISSGGVEYGQSYTTMPDILNHLGQTPQGLGQHPSLQHGHQHQPRRQHQRHHSHHQQHAGLHIQALSQQGIQNQADHGDLSNQPSNVNNRPSIGHTSFGNMNQDLGLMNMGPRPNSFVMPQHQQHSQHRHHSQQQHQAQIPRSTGDFQAIPHFSADCMGRSNNGGLGISHMDY